MATKFHSGGYERGNALSLRTARGDELTRRVRYHGTCEYADCPVSRIGNLNEQERIMSMSTRIIVLMLAVTAGLVVTVFVLNSMWTRMFGGGAVAQPVGHQQQVVDRKQLRAEHDAKEAAKREHEKHSPETLRAAARSGIPKPLTAEEFDPATGKVHWPDALQIGEFNELRGKAERLLKERAGAPGDDALSVRAQAAVEALLNHLKDNIRSLPSDEYVKAHRFLESLMYGLSPKK